MSVSSFARTPSYCVPVLRRPVISRIHHVRCPSRHRGIGTWSDDRTGKPLQAADEFALVASRGRGAGGTPVSGAAGLHVLVELAGEMEPFEDELERGGHARRIRRAELLRRGLERGPAV